MGVGGLTYGLLLKHLPVGGICMSLFGMRVGVAVVWVVESHSDGPLSGVWGGGGLLRYQARAPCLLGWSWGPGKGADGGLGTPHLWPDAGLNLDRAAMKMSSNT